MSKYFKPEEFWCKCGRADCDGKRNPSQSLVVLLDIMREQYGAPLIVTSGIRCKKQNAAVGGVEGSEHVTGEAADLACPDSRSRYLILDAAYIADFRRIGVGKTFLHVGVSTTHDQNVTWLYP